MKALAICGSRRADGSTEQLLRHALEALKRKGIEGTLIRMLWKTVLPCNDCGACETRRNGTCAIEGDDFGALFREMRQADLLLIGMPVDRGAAPPDMKALLERACRVARSTDNLLGRRIGAPVPVYAVRPSSHGLQRLLGWFSAVGMIVPGPGVYAGGKKGTGIAIRNDEAGRAAAEKLAGEVAWLAERLGPSGKPGEPTNDKSATGSR